MALSLADELAAFDEQAMGGGGLSLADEFGLEMEMGSVKEDGFGGDDLEAELNASTPASPLPKPKRKPSGLLNGISSHAKGPTDVDHVLDELDENVHVRAASRGTRSAKSSSSTMYGTATTRSGHDETDIDALLEGGTSVGDTTFDTAPMPASPMTPGTPARSRLDDSQSRGSPALKGKRSAYGMNAPRDAGAFLGHKVERDPLVELNEILESNRPFLDLVTRLDEPRTSGSPSRSRGMVASASTGALAGETIEFKLQRHLERLHDEDRVREEQCRELAVLSREMGTIRWDSVEMQIELEIASGHGLGLGMIDENEDEEADEMIGWTGEPMPQESAVHRDRSLRAETPEVEDDRDRLLGPPSPMATSIPLSPLDRMASKAPEHVAPLPRTSHMLVSSTPDLVTTLHHLAEAVHSAGSMTTSSTRQLRGIKAGVDSWRERENLEEDARRGVEDHERTALEAGLRGEARERTADILKRECDDFRLVLDRLEDRMEQVRREGMFRKAIR